MKAIITTIVLLALLATGATAAPFFVSTDRLGYTGTVTYYATAGDLQSGNGTTYSMPVLPEVGTSRDLAIFIVKDAPAYYADSMDVLTAWYYSTNMSKAEYSGWGNPSNTNTGFVQLYDDDYSTVTSGYGKWTSATYDKFEMKIVGQNAGTADWARLWAAPTVGGAAEITKGTFLNYEFALTATGLNGTYDAVTGLVVSEGDPTGVNGYFRGLFQNQSTTMPELNGFYAFDFTLNMDSWAFAQGNEALNGDLYPSQFGAQAVPEPMSIMLGMLGLGSIAGFRRFKK